MNKLNFCFFALGCKVNLFESEALSKLAEQSGHKIVDEMADVCVINSCTVTSTSDHKNIRAIRKLKKLNPDAIIAVAGCMAQIEPEKLKETGLVDLVCGTSDRKEIIKLCEDFWLNKNSIPDTSHFRTGQKLFEKLPSGVPRGRTRALLKIQDGCDNYCTYCIIPYARGHVRSLPLEDAVNSAINLANNDVKEIVLTGIEISSYGRDLANKPDLVDLIDAICKAVPNVRIRLGSLEPRTADERFCKMLSIHSNLMPHFHLSLQSGSDSVLKRMKRKYSAQTFFDNIMLLRKYFPNCSITTDIIVGFPDETNEEFAETMDFVKKCNFSAIHVFPYSPRKDTPAASMPNQIDEQIKKQRANTLKNLGYELQNNYLKSFIGQTLSVLWEHQDNDGLWCGHAQYNFIVKTDSKLCSKNKYHDAKIISVKDDCLIASLANLTNKT